MNRGETANLSLSIDNETHLPVPLKLINWHALTHGYYQTIALNDPGQDEVLQTGLEHPCF